VVPYWQPAFAGSLHPHRPVSNGVRKAARATFELEVGLRFRGSLVFLTVAIPLAAQQPEPAGLVHGSLLECDATGGSGELSIRAADNQVFRFVFDPKTYFEREREHVTPMRLQKGDWLEIVADKLPGSMLRYARTVHVVEQKTPAHVPRSVARLHAYRSTLEQLFPRGDMTFSGVVERLNSERLVLHTRADGEKTILLRQDTRYLSDGNQVEVSSLQPNTRVFVRAGKNLDNQIEAYQVVWGEILEPR
jgi:hypothetical protein